MFHTIPSFSFSIQFQDQSNFLFNHYFKISLIRFNNAVQNFLLVILFLFNGLIIVIFTRLKYFLFLRLIALLYIVFIAKFKI